MATDLLFACAFPCNDSLLSKYWRRDGPSVGKNFVWFADFSVSVHRRIISCLCFHLADFFLLRVD